MRLSFRLRLAMWSPSCRRTLGVHSEHSEHSAHSAHTGHCTQRTQCTQRTANTAHTAHSAHSAHRTHAGHCTQRTQCTQRTANTSDRHSGWWLGERNGQTGIFPSNFTRELPHKPANRHVPQQPVPTARPRTRTQGAQTQQPAKSNASKISDADVDSLFDLVDSIKPDVRVSNALDAAKTNVDVAIAHFAQGRDSAVRAVRCMRCVRCVCCMRCVLCAVGFGF
jgi:hypothetical protein